MAYSSFVVRLWIDDSGEMNSGFIEHVATRESTYFVAFDQMLSFMTAHYSLPTDPTTEPEGRYDKYPLGNNTEKPGKD